MTIFVLGASEMVEAKKERTESARGAQTGLKQSNLNDGRSRPRRADE